MCSSRMESPRTSKGEDFAVADDVAEGDGLGGFDGFDGLAGGDAAEQGEAVEAASLERYDWGVHRSTGCGCGRALEEALVLEVGDVFVDSGEGVEAEAGGDLFVGRGVAVLLP